MCGIWVGIFDKTIDVSFIVYNVSKLLHHRGPDNFNYKILSYENKTIIMIHTRLHIIGNSLPQPIINFDKDLFLVINGEIFNWKELSTELDYKCIQSDCEIILALYEKYVRYDSDFNTFFNKINGQYSFVLYDQKYNKLFVSRDHIGITPLYVGFSNNYDQFIFSSELKALTFLNTISNVNHFVPRHYLYQNLDFNYNLLLVKPYIDYYNTNISSETNLIYIQNNIKNLLINSVNLQLNDIINLNIEFGILLSGGLDSSLIASIICNEFKKRNLSMPKTFSIGINKMSADLIASRTVAKFLNTEHYEFLFTPEEGIESIEKTIYYLETYDTTTIRAGTAMYLLTSKIKKLFPNIKVLFSGELSDELFCYVYGSNAPNYSDFQKETEQLVSNVYLFDCLRSNKSCMANSIEVRVPFTDPHFVKYVLSINPKFKSFGKLNNNCIEKQLLRNAFNLQYLPYEILYRKKEAFSDGVSVFNGNNEINWINILKDYCNKKYSNMSFLIEIKKFKHNTPNNKEELLYRNIFHKLFNVSSEHTVKFWKPNWCGENVDPSARIHIKNVFHN